MEGVESQLIRRLSYLEHWLRCVDFPAVRRRDALGSHSCEGAMTLDFLVVYLHHFEFHEKPHYSNRFVQKKVPEIEPSEPSAAGILN